jgi:ParB family chromosome partitioning protein
MMLATPQYEKGNLYQLSIADLRPDPDQPRKVIDPVALEDLKASITQLGILTPLLFRMGEESWLIIVSGERRYQAAMALGMTIVPGICVEGNFAEIALVENLQRQDLTAVEEAEALKRLMDQQSYTQEQLGGIVGKARTTVNEILSINRLPLEIRDACRGDHQISRRTLIEMASRKQERGMLTAWAAYQASLEKEKTPRQQKDPNDPETFFTLLEKTGEKIDAIDTALWDEETLTRLNEAVATLRDRLSARFPEENPGASTGLA